MYTDIYIYILVFNKIINIDPKAKKTIKHILRLKKQYVSAQSCVPEILRYSQILKLYYRTNRSATDGYILILVQ